MDKQTKGLEGRAIHSFAHVQKLDCDNAGVEGQRGNKAPLIRWHGDNWAEVKNRHFTQDKT